MHIALGARPMILPGGAAVDRTHQTAELDPHEEELAIVRARRDPADMEVHGRGGKRQVGRDGSSNKASSSSPTLATVVAPEKGTRLRSRVHRTVDGTDRNGEHARGRQATVDPTPAAVAGSPQTTLAKTRINNVGVMWIDRKALRPGPSSEISTTHSPSRSSSRAMPSPVDAQSRTTSL